MSTGHPFFENALSLQNSLAETKHVIDFIDRCIAWYEKHFPKPGAEGVTNVQP